MGFNFTLRASARAEYFSTERKVFIGKFAWNCTKLLLSQRLLAEGCSGVAEVHIVRKGGWAPGKYCCAFVLFEDADQAAKMLEFNGSTWPEVFFLFEIFQRTSFLRVFLRERATTHEITFSQVSAFPIELSYAKIPAKVPPWRRGHVEALPPTHV